MRAMELGYREVGGMYWVMCPQRVGVELNEKGRKFSGISDRPRMQRMRLVSERLVADRVYPRKRSKTVDFHYLNPGMGRPGRCPCQILRKGDAVQVRTEMDRMTEEADLEGSVGSVQGRRTYLECGSFSKIPHTSRYHHQRKRRRDDGAPSHHVCW